MRKKWKRFGFENYFDIECGRRTRLINTKKQLCLIDKTTIYFD